MTSRPVEQIYCWDEYRILELCPMKKGQVKNLIQKLDFDETTKEKFINELNQDFYEKYERFASIPLTLSILFITYIENTTIPETLQEFYEVAFDTLLYRHDQMKEGYTRNLKSELGRLKFREIFIRFCYATYFKDMYSFSDVCLMEQLSEAIKKIDQSVDTDSYKDDLVDVTCMLIRDGQEYTFLHRSFQEYFAAYYVSRMFDKNQKIFCSKFINALDFLPTKAFDFFRILRNIEQNKFDAIVLQPIFEKIYKLYIALNNDIVSLISKLYSITTLGDTYGLVYVPRRDESDVDVTENELYLLDDLIYHYESVDDIGIDKNEYILSCLNRIEKECFQEGNPANAIHAWKLFEDIPQHEQKNVYCMLLYNNARVALDKYDELKRTFYSGIIDFDDMVDNF